MPLDPLFADKTWLDIRKVIAANLRRKFPSLGVDTRADCTSVGILALWSYWMPKYGVDLEGDPRRAFNFAIEFGYNRACESARRAMRLGQERSLDEPVGTPADGGDPQTLADTLADPAPGPEDIVCSDGRAMADAFTRLSSQHRANLAGLAAGRSKPHEAAYAGCAKSTISLRRQAGLCALRHEAVKAGLGV